MRWQSLEAESTCHKQIQNVEEWVQKTALTPFHSWFSYIAAQRLEFLKPGTLARELVSNQWGQTIDQSECLCYCNMAKESSRGGNQVHCPWELHICPWTDTNPIIERRENPSPKSFFSFVLSLKKQTNKHKLLFRNLIFPFSKIPL